MRHGWHAHGLARKAVVMAPGEILISLFFARVLYLPQAATTIAFDYNSHQQGALPFWIAALISLVRP
jgi:hypothetical protein